MDSIFNFLFGTSAAGKKGDIIEVSDGYARNFLLKKGLADIATASGINEISQRKTADAFHKAENCSFVICVLSLFLKLALDHSTEIFSGVSDKFLPFG